MYLTSISDSFNKGIGTVRTSDNLSMQMERKRFTVYVVGYLRQDAALFQILSSVKCIGVGRST
jgi:hypothetical protein